MRHQSLEYIAQQTGYRNAKRYVNRCDFVFKGLPLDGKRVLDVGCGTGALALWAAISGASYVLGIEPERDGSRTGAREAFHTTIRKLGLEGIVEDRASLLSDLNDKDERFDLAIMYNVINHLDEDAVTTLNSSNDSWKKYSRIFTELRKRLNENAVLIIADSSRHNFWDAVGLVSPLAQTIEWNKHQTPQLWLKLLEECNFKLFDIRWSPFSYFRILTSNKFVQYLTASHFVLRVQAI